jgi:outer membrane protein insertion porin family
MIARCLNRRIWIVVVVLVVTGLLWNGGALAADTPDGKIISNTVEDIQFLGAEHLSKKELQNLIGIQKGDPMNPLANRLGQQFILRKYREEGRTYASAELVEGNLPTDTRVIYRIIEGPVVKVTGIRFAGVDQATAERLHEQFVTKRKFDTVIGEKFDSETLDLDRQKLTKYYHGLGFLNVQITPEVIPTLDVGHIVIVYHIVEGQQYIVATKQINGNKSFDTATLEGLTELKLRKPYDGHIAEADIKRMRDYMSERGYAIDIELHFFDVPGQPGMVQVHYDVVNDSGTPKRGRIRIPLAD